MSHSISSFFIFNIGAFLGLKNKVIKFMWRLTYGTKYYDAFFLLYLLCEDDCNKS